MKRKGILLLVLLIALSVMLLSTTAFAAGNEIYLSNTGNDANPGTSAEPVRTLEKAMELAGDGGTIYVCSQITVSTDTIVENVTLKRGNGYTGVLLNVSGGTLTIQNATLDGSGVTASSPLLNVNTSCTLVLNNGATVTGNTGGYAAIQVTGTMTMNGGSVTGNTNDGSYEYGYGGGIMGFQCTLNLNGGSITGNATATSGGGVFAYYGSTLNLGGTEISGNRADLNGGGIFFESDGGASTLTMNGGSILNNTSGGDGGGIHVWNGGGELNVNISGGTISGNTDCVGASSIALNQLASDFARLNLSGSPSISGEIFLFDEANGTGPTIHVSDGFAPASAIPVRTNYTPTIGATAVYYDGSDTPNPAHFTSAASSYGLKAEGQTLVWSELYRVAFYDENNRTRFAYLYILPGSTIDESLVPTPTKEGYSLLGWRRYSDGTYWNFATDTVTYGPQSLLSWWKADAPSVTVSASATEAHPGDSITLTATVTHDAAADMTFTYQWYKDGTAIPNATADTLTVTESGSYTVEVIADPGRLEASDPGAGTAACTVAHTFDDTKWVSGEDTHYHLCTVAGCTARSDEAEHTFAWVIDKAATTAEPGSRHQECTVCGYEKAAEEIPVIHHFDTKWSYDEKVHYHACTVEGCTAREDEAEHTFQWVVDKKATTSKEGSKHEECTVCGYKKAAVAIPVLNPDTPSTGDHSNLLLWAVVLVLALAGLGATAFFTVRKKRGSSK